MLEWDKYLIAVPLVLLVMYLFQKCFKSEPRAQDLIRSESGRRAMQWTEEGRSEEAIPLFEEALGSMEESSSSSPPPGTLLLLSAYAICLLRAKRPAESVEQFRRALEISDDPVLRCNLGVALSHCRRHEEALEELKKGLALDFENASLHFNVARCYQDMNLHDNASDHFRACLLNDSNHSKAVEGLLISLATQGLRSEAEAVAAEHSRIISPQLLPVVWKQYAPSSSSSSSSSSSTSTPSPPPSSSSPSANATQGEESVSHLNTTPCFGEKEENLVEIDRSRSSESAGVRDRRRKGHRRVD